MAESFDLATLQQKRANALRAGDAAAVARYDQRIATLPKASAASDADPAALRQKRANALRAGDTEAVARYDQRLGTAQQAAQSPQQQPAARAGQMSPMADRAVPQNEEQAAQQRAAVDVAEYQSLPGWQKPIVAATDVAEFVGKSIPYVEKGIARLKAIGEPTYAETLAHEQRRTEAARNRAGNPGTVLAGELAVPMAGFRNKALQGAGFLGRLGYNALEGLGWGTAYGGSEDDYSRPWPERATNLATSAGVGTAFGGGGSVVADLAGAGLHGIGRVVEDIAGRAREPAEKVWAKVSRAFHDAGMTQADIDAEIAKHGPETVVADLLKRGPAQLRKAGNVSTEASEIAQDRLAQRAAGRNDRIATTAIEASGLPASGFDKGMRDELAAKYVATMNRPVQRAQWVDELSPEGKKIVNDRLAAEKKFKATHQGAFPPEPSLQRIVLEGMGQAALGAGAGAVGQILTGYGDPMTGGLLGAGWKGYKRAMPLLRAAVTRAEGPTAKTAPYFADVLTSPASEVKLAPISSYEDAVNRGRDLLTRLATRVGPQQYQQYGGPR